MKKLGVEVHSIPQRSPDINPIENVFHLLDRKLRSEAVEQNITNESYKEFSARVKSTIENIPVEQIDKIIDTMPKRSVTLSAFAVSESNIEHLLIEPGFYSI